MSCTVYFVNMIEYVFTFVMTFLASGFSLLSQEDYIFGGLGSLSNFATKFVCNFYQSPNADSSHTIAGVIVLGMDLNEHTRDSFGSSKTDTQKSCRYACRNQQFRQHNRLTHIRSPCNN